MTDHQAEAERLLAEYRRSREQLAAVHRKLAAISVDRTSDDGTVTVTVGAQGTLAGLEIEPDAYRLYRPDHLARLVLDLSADAAKEASEQAQRLLQPVLPPGADPAATLAGTADLRPDELAPPVPAQPRDADEPFHQKSWLEQAHQGRRP